MNTPFIPSPPVYLPKLRILKWQIFDAKNNFIVWVSYRLSMHSLKRLKERNISMAAICKIIEYGRVEFCKGCILYALGKDYPSESRKKSKLRLKNTVIVVSADDNKIITCYRSKDPIKHICEKAKKSQRRRK